MSEEDVLRSFIELTKRLEEDADNILETVVSDYQKIHKNLKVKPEMLKIIAFQIFLYITYNKLDKFFNSEFDRIRSDDVKDAIKIFNKEELQKHLNIITKYL